MKITEDIKNIINKSGDVCILSHVSPDGDGLGSCFALGLALKGMGKKVVIVVEDEVPFSFKNLPGNELLKNFGETAEKFETVIALDTGDEDRLGRRVSLFKNAEHTLNIDHHVTNRNYAEHNLVDPSASAVGEVVYFLLKDMGIKIDSDIAKNLYVAILTDTGSFNYSNTTAETHRIVAELLERGVNAGEISQLIFENVSVERLKITGEAIHTLEMHSDGRIGVMCVTEDMMKSVGARDDDCEGIVDTIRKIKGVEVAVFIREKESNLIRVNLRSKTTVNVSKVAEKFAGGGHEKAAGCTIRTSLQEAKDSVIAAIKSIL